MVAVVVDAVRTPLAPPMEQLKGWHPAVLLAEILNAAVSRSAVDPTRIERVVAGCANPIGEQAVNIARNAVLGAGWPERVAASTIDGQIVSGLFALENVVSAVQSGSIRLGVAAGVESASRVPDGATSGVAVGKPFGPLVHQRYESVDGLVSPAMVAEAIARQHKLSRRALDKYATESVGRFENAQKTGAFKAEIHELSLKNANGVDTATVIHQDVLVTRPHAAGELKPLFESDGVLTAATFAGPADGACALLIADAQLAEAEQWPVLARVMDVAISGSSPVNGDTGAALCSLVMERNGLTAADLSRVEVFEDSAASPVAFARETGINPALINPSGGALSSGSALGATAGNLVTSLAHGLDGRWGLAVIAGGATTGMVGAVLLERL